MNFRMFERFTFAPGVFKPVVDGAFSSDPFLPDHRHVLMEEGRFNKVRNIGSYYIFCGKRN